MEIKEGRKYGNEDNQGVSLFILFDLFIYYLYNNNNNNKINEYI
jgi:hypothetical protein